MSDDPRTLRDELHDLADDVASTATAASRARDRAHRGIVRHRRNQRAAMAGLATVVLVAGVTAAFALGRDSRHSAPPAGPTTVAPAPTTTAAPSPTTASAPNTSPPGTITVPPRSGLPQALGYDQAHFGWGRGLGQVAYSLPQGEGASGGPAAFSFDLGGTRLFDFSNSRILSAPRRAAPSAQHVDLPSPAVTAAVFDDQGFAIAALPGELVVFGAANQQSTFPYAGPEITRLASYGTTVYSVSPDGALQPLLHRIDKSTYVAGGTLAQPAAVEAAVSADRHTVTLRVPSTGEHYSLSSADPVGGVAAAARLADGSIDFVLAPVYRGTDLDEPQVFVLGHIPPSEQYRFATVQASQGYLVNGPQWQVNDLGIAVMTSSTVGGVTVSTPIVAGDWPNPR